jgi:outer membrane protein OmpA-like peptidoglycan-associated protein
MMMGGAALLAGYYGLTPLPDEAGPEQASVGAKGETPANAAAPDTATPSVRDDAQAPGVSIDIARISRDGSSVFAGRSEPNSYVTILEGDRPVGWVKADSNGEWTLVTEHKFASLDPNLTYTASPTRPAEAAAREVAAADTRSAVSSGPAQGSVSDAARSAGRPDDAKGEVSSPATPQAVTAELLKKFEGMVAEAREEAKREREKAASSEATAAAEKKSAESAPSATAAAPAASPPPSSARADTRPQNGATSPPASVTGTVAPGAPDARPEASPSAAPRPSEAPAPRAAAATAAPASSPRSDTSASEASPQSPAAIPVPIMFVYNESTFTEDGQKAADLLLEYLLLKHPVSVTLSGHADERGSEEYNMDLSRERLEAVERYLKAGGFTGQLNLIPKGKSEPYMGVDRSKYAGEALFQLDRRVELRLLR